MARQAGPRWQTSSGTRAARPGTAHRRPSRARWPDPRMQLPLVLL